jgi:predicted DNA binding CopG/RHH family protein
MKRNRRYRDEPLGRVEVVEEFLPPPDQLVLRDAGVKITMSLSKRSVDFFKRHAAQSRVPYQKMIRSLLDSYAKHHGAGL